MKEITEKDSEIICKRLVELVDFFVEQREILQPVVLCEVLETVIQIIYENAPCYEHANYVITKALHNAAIFRLQMHVEQTEE